MDQEILQQLKDIHMPDPPSIWPLAIGYYLALFLVVLIAAWLIYFLVFGLRKRRLRRHISQAFLKIEVDYKTRGDVGALQAGLNALLKRIVFLRAKNIEKRSFELDDVNDVITTIFSNKKKTLELLSLLKKDRYHRLPDVDGDRLLKLFKEQIPRCRI